MKQRKGASHSTAPPTFDKSRIGQVVLVLQGGGALGAYQAGVYQALLEAQIEPDWLIGTSIGAINASLIAGNAPNARLRGLREFWLEMTQRPLSQMFSVAPFYGHWVSNMLTISQGVPHFFAPNPPAFLSPIAPLGSENAGYYSMAPLERTLAKLIDPEVLNCGKPRLTVGAANVRTGDMRYFDSREAPLTIRHVMASGALPPAFPAVRIDGELYWDGGVLSNTPVEAVFDDDPRRSGLVFVVHMWNPHGPEPDTIGKVLARYKDLQYASRAKSHIARQNQIHRLRHVIAELCRVLPDDVRERPDIRELESYGCTTRIHVVRLLAPPLSGQDHAKDIDFRHDRICARWDAGYADTTRMIAQAPWADEVDPIEGFFLHEASAGAITGKA